MRDNGSERYEQELLTALVAVRSAAGVCRAVQTRLVDASTFQKLDKSPVTVADFASQAVVCATLAGAFPDDPVVGEEDATDLRGTGATEIRATVTSHVRAALGHDVTESDVLDLIDRGGSGGYEHARTRRFWTLDPIDGTKGFLRREQYAVALALVVDGAVVLGALACPNLPHAGGVGLVMIARKGLGTQELPLDTPDPTGRRLYTPARVALSAARLCESVESNHSDQDQSVVIARALGLTREPLRMDSQAKYAAVARGDAQVYLRLPTQADYREKIWDHAAGMLVVQEAGGVVTDVDGRALDFTQGRQLEQNRGVVATVGGIHDEVIKAVQEVVGRQRILKPLA